MDKFEKESSIPLKVEVNYNNNSDEVNKRTYYERIQAKRSKNWRLIISVSELNIYHRDVLLSLVFI